jgi:hypothetical protein
MYNSSLTFPFNYVPHVSIWGKSQFLIADVASMVCNVSNSMMGANVPVLLKSIPGCEKLCIRGLALYLRIFLAASCFFYK